MTNTLILVKAGPEWRSALLGIAEEYAAHGEARYQMALADCDGYLQMLAADDAGTTPGHVRMTSYWAMEAGLMVGSIRLRYTLTPALRQVGGHIGYDVRPSRRGQGYGTQMLALTLQSRTGGGAGRGADHVRRYQHRVGTGDRKERRRGATVPGHGRGPWRADCALLDPVDERGLNCRVILPCVMYINCPRCSGCA